jgi:hypothetical protein
MCNVMGNNVCCAIASSTIVAADQFEMYLVSLAKCETTGGTAPISTEGLRDSRPSKGSPSRVLTDMNKGSCRLLAVQCYVNGARGVNLPHRAVRGPGPWTTSPRGRVSLALTPRQPARSRILPRINILPTKYHLVGRASNQCGRSRHEQHNFRDAAGAQLSPTACGAFFCQDREPQAQRIGDDADG